MTSWLKDWWRGYSDVDIENVRRRVAESASPGSAIGMTSREYLALVENPVPPRHAIANPIDAFRIEDEARRAARNAIRAERGEAQIIDDIFAIRVRNNVPWKRLMEIAMKHAPEETKAALRDINTNDQAISGLMGELAK